MDFLDDFDDEIYANVVKKYEEATAANQAFYFDREEYQELIEYYLGQTNIEKAESALSHALLQHPYSIDIKVTQAKIWLTKGKLTAALKLLDDLEMVEASNPELLITKGNVLSRLKQSEKAIQYLKKALIYSEFKEDVYWMLAMEYQQNLNYETAIVYHKKALKENPDNEMVLSEIGLCFECLGNHQEAIDFYNNYLDNNPYSEIAWYNIAIIYTNIEEMEKAIAAYDYCIIINPQYSPSAFFNKASLLAIQGKYEEAIETFKESFKYEEANTISYCQLGECFEKIQDYTTAIEYYQKGVEADQQNPDAWLGLAICFNHLKEHQKAYVAINTALNLDSEDVDLYYAKSEIEESLGDIESAVESMRIAMELDGDDIELKLDYLEMLRRNFELIEVLKTVEFFLEEHKNEKLLYFKVAVLLEMNKFATAYHLFERALANDYDNHTLLFSFFNEAKNDQNILELIDLYKKS
jgi:tetratricopeptide (TPR) repeat protein